MVVIPSLGFASIISFSQSSGTLTVLVGNQILSVVAMNEEVRNLHIGDKIMLLPKTFSPMLTAMN